MMKQVKLHSWIRQHFANKSDLLLQIVKISAQRIYQQFSGTWKL